MSSAWLLFGGSFNPIHNGHMIVAGAAAEHLGINKVLLLPAASPPHKSAQCLASFEDRHRMCWLAASLNPMFEVSEWERNIDGPNYTLLTVLHHAKILNGPIYWLIGMDMLNSLHTWYRLPELVDVCNIVAVGRPGFPASPNLKSILDEKQMKKIESHIIFAPMIEISSTDIRNRIKDGKNITYFVPSPVEEYILKNHLFR